MLKILLPLLAGTAVCTGAAFNVRDYGAAGDGAKKETAAIARAIDACAKAGGGTVYFPPGRYLTGTINLKSNLVLEVEAGATILASGEDADYPPRPSPWNDGRRELSSVIYGEGLTNITLKGRGTIDGQGKSWWERVRSGKLPLGRPRLIRFVRCRNLWMEGLTLVNSPSWTVNPVFSEYLTFTGLTILNPVPSPNTDGINPESCRNVHISNCHIDVGDDCVTLKSGTDAIGRKAGKPCENITVTNCTMARGHGGVVVGSEMSGGVRNVSISNCVFQGTQRGLRIKSQRGRGGVVEGIAASNIVMQDVPEAFNITTFYHGKDTAEEEQPVDEGTPRFRDIRISNITARGSKTAGEITGLREMPISGISFSNVRIAAARGFTIVNARDIEFHDVEIDSEGGAALSAGNVERLELDGFRTAAPHAGAPVIDLNGVRDAFLRGCSTPRGTEMFVKVSGEKSAGIVLSGNDLRYAKEAVALGAGAGPGVVITGAESINHK